MNELELVKTSYFWEPKALLCYTESKILREKGEDDHPEEIYVDQIPIGLKVYHSKDTFTFKDHEFNYTYYLVLATCSKCGALNHYAPGFWHDKDGSHFNELQTSDVTEAES